MSTTRSTTRSPFAPRIARLPWLLAAATLLGGCDAPGRAMGPGELPEYDAGAVPNSGTSDFLIRALGDSVHIATPREPVPGTPGIPDRWVRRDDPSSPCPPAWGQGSSRCVLIPGTPGTPGDPNYLQLTNLTPDILELTDAGWAIALDWGDGRIEVETYEEIRVVTVRVENPAPPSSPPPPGYPHTKIYPSRLVMQVGGTEEVTARIYTAADTWMSEQQSRWSWTSSDACLYVWRGRLRADCPGDFKVAIERNGMVDTMVVNVRDVATGPGGSYTVPAAIDRTGQRDASHDLALFLISVPDGSTIHFPAGAIYRMDGRIIAWNRANLTIEGNGATLRQHGRGDRERKMLNFRGVENLVIRNLRFVGTNEALVFDDKFGAGQHALRVSDARNVLIEGLEINDTWGDCLSVTPGGGRSRNIVIRNNRLDGCGRQGIAISGVDTVYFEHNYLNRMRRSAIDIEPGINREEFDTHHVYVRHNVFGPAISYRTLAMLGVADISHVYYQFNHHEGHIDFETRGGSGWQRVGERRRHLYITDNTSSGRKSSTPINVYRWTDVVVTRNQQVINAKRDGPAIGVKTEYDCGFTAQGARIRVFENDFRLGGPVASQPNGGLQEWSHLETC